jgi:hypothetical protein
MRAQTLVSIPPLVAAALLGSTSILAADEPAAAAKPPAVVWLRGLSDLEKLKQANPNHYARAQKIMAAADQVCKPGPLAVVPADADAKDTSCVDMMVLTSYPPKRQIGFRLDDVRYVALVVLTESSAEFQRVPLDPAR